MTASKQFLIEHPDFEQITEVLFTNGKEQIHTATLDEYVKWLEEMGKIKFTSKDGLN
jgi:hypothetical protein